jgi:polyisoprenoid-binding protein YceI
MKNVLTLLALLVGGSLLANGPVKPVKVNVEKSVINWKAAKVTGEHMGTLNLKEASLEMDNGVLIGGSFTADMTSINVTDLTGEYKAKLEGHLRSDDFFSVDKHNEATFVITKVNAKGNGQYDVTGDFTIKGITNPVNFVANVSDNGATAKFKIDRAKYDIRYGSGSFFEGLGDKMIYDEFDLDIQLVF